MGYIGVVTHLLTIDPNFMGHPSNPHSHSREASKQIAATHLTGEDAEYFGSIVSSMFSLFQVGAEGDSTHNGVFTCEAPIIEMIIAIGSVMDCYFCCLDLPWCFKLPYHPWDWYILPTCA